MLTLVATPIGHLDDISKRALQTLEACDAILCEDTRRSSHLLEKYGIRKRLISYDKFKEKKRLNSILKDLEGGAHLALISDAGTPCINDPGWLLVQACIEKGIPLSAIPGPCSIIQALVLSGMETERFQFIGFLPKKPEKALRQAFAYPGTTVAFDSPERIVETAKVAQKLDPERRLAVVREMTKVFEECIRGKPGELLAHFQKAAPRGEMVLVIGAGPMAPQEMPIEEVVELLQEFFGLSLKEAIKAAARFLNQPKRAVYKSLIGTSSKN